MATAKTYGLMPCIWRALRAKHPGATSLTVYDRQGFALCFVFLYRYEAMVQMPLDLDFKLISWKQTIARTRPQTMGTLGPTDIPIGARTWG